MNRFAGATAIVTGGASGIGRALVTALADRGTTVVLADVDEDAAELVAKELDGGRGLVSPVHLDVRDAEAARAVVHDVRDRHGHLDLLFNNAGIGGGGNLEDLTLAHWDRIIDV